MRSGVLFPGLPVPNGVEDHADPLVVGRVQPQQTFAAGRGRLVKALAPLAEQEPVQAAQEGAVLVHAPGEQPVEALVEGEVGDLDARLEVAMGDPREGLEVGTPQVGEGVQAAEVLFERVQEDAVSLLGTTRSIS